MLCTLDQQPRQPILAAVGELQFEVVVARLKEEYGVDARIERLPFTQARWIDGAPEAVACMQVAAAGHMAR